MTKDQVLEELSLLGAQHLLIKAAVSSFQSALDRGQSPSSKETIEFLDFMHLHHSQEESRLFPWLGTQTFLQHGGPRCTHFMGRRMELGIKGFEYWQERAGRSRPPWLSQSSPLEVPMEEHCHGEFLARKIRQNLDRDQAAVRLALIELVDLVDFHRQKEDECLFPLIQRNLS